MNILKRISLKVLNFFPRMMERQGSVWLTNLVVMGLLAVCLLLCVRMTTSIDPKLAIFVDSFELPRPQSVTIGEGSDVCFHKVKHDFLTLTPNADGTFGWAVNEAYRDSLMYFKINDENPQKHSIGKSEAQSIRINVPGEGGRKDSTIVFSGKEIWDEWTENFDAQHDVNVRHFVARYGLEHKSRTAADSMYWKSLCDEKCVRSFMEKNDGGIVLVILDERTFITENGEETGYRMSGTTSTTDDERRNRCKVQFFDIADHCYMDGDSGNGTFQIDGVNYAMKPVVNLTEWGAGHVMMELEADGNLTMRYPKALGYVGTIDSLYANTGRTSHFFTLKQNEHTFPVGTDIYLPQMSRAIPQDLCNVQMGGGNKVWLHDSDNSSDSIRVERTKTAFLPMAIVPGLMPVTLHSGNVALHCRAGLIDSAFAWTYMVLPMGVALVLIALVLCPWSPVRVRTDDVTDFPYYSETQLRRYPVYMALLIGVATMYCVCKSLIALKLSYTYPYFEKMTGITPVATSLMLLLFFTAAMILNHKMIDALEGDRDEFFGDASTRHGRRKWGAWAIVTLMFVAVGYVFFRVLDPMVSAEVIKSYFPHQISDPNPLHWRNAFGINDTHRSVPYTLMLIEAVLLVVWAVVNSYYQSAWVRARMDGARAACQHWLEDMWRRMAGCLHAQIDTAKERALGEGTTLNGWRQSVSRMNESKAVRRAVVVMHRLQRFVHTHFILSLAVLMVLIFAAFFIERLTRPLTILAMMWTVVCLWDAVVLAVKALFPRHLAVLLMLAIVGPMLGNFGTAFISIVVVVGLCKALSGVRFESSEIQNARYKNSGQSEYMETRHVVFFEMIIISLIYMACAMVADNGYMTNYIGFLLTVLCFYFIIDKRGAWEIANDEDAMRESKWVACLSAFALVLLVTMPTLCGKLFNTQEVNYNRFSRRIMLYSDFSDLQSSGYRYAESDAEFMTIMSHYMQNNKGNDPLSNEDHFLHMSVSSGQSPVVLNDLSVPVAFIGSYGVVRASAVYFILLFTLLILVVQFSMGYEATIGWESYLTKAMQWRLLALFMWIGTSFYIYMSYLGQVPFTGRLNPGFGVDAVGEALESALLLAFMAAVTVRKEES